MLVVTPCAIKRALALLLPLGDWARTTAIHVLEDDLQSFGHFRCTHPEYEYRDSQTGYRVDVSLSVSAKNCPASTWQSMYEVLFNVCQVRRHCVLHIFLHVAHALLFRYTDTASFKD